MLRSIFCVSSMIAHYLAICGPKRWPHILGLLYLGSYPTGYIVQTQLVEEERPSIGGHREIKVSGIENAIQRDEVLALDDLAKQYGIWRSIRRYDLGESGLTRCVMQYAQLLRGEWRFR